MYEAIVFDMDGVLLARHADYPDVYRQAVVEAFDAFDVEPEDDEVDEFYAGTSKSIERMSDVCERHGLDLAEFWPERERCTSELQQRFVERGERECFEDCDAIATLAREHDLAIVSNNQQATVDAVLAAFPWGEYFDVAFGREATVEGYRNKKPDPHYVERALAALGTRDALFVGDGAADVEAAHAANLDAAFLRRGDDALAVLSAEPEHVIDGLDELPDLVGAE